MGMLHYAGDDLPHDVDDHLLAHLRVVISTKLRRSESFTLTLVHPEGSPTGRTTLWLQPAIPLRFTFDSAGPESLDRALLQQMANEANSARGVVVTLEAGEPVRSIGSVAA